MKLIFVYTISINSHLSQNMPQLQSLNHNLDLPHVQKVLI